MTPEQGKRIAELINQRDIAASVITDRNSASQTVEILRRSFDEATAELRAMGIPVETEPVGTGIEVYN